MSNVCTKFNLANKFTFDPNTNSLIGLLNANEIIRLGSNESRILVFLSERPNQVVSRHELYDFVWREQGFEVDDSSLTQAISTLRKLLNDSTKSPEFVKTVPRRGYQLICHVERSIPINNDESANSIDNTSLSSSASLLDSGTSQEPEIHLSLETIKNVDSVEIKTAETRQTTTLSPLRPWLTKAALFFTVLLPIWALIINKTTTSPFNQLASFSGVAVKTPANHPDLSQWLPAIEQCVTRYKINHTGQTAPIEVIATGGQNNQLVLNYIHQMQHSNENITVRIFSNQDNIDHICQ